MNTQYCINCQLRNKYDDLLYCGMCMVELFCSKCKTNLKGKDEQRCKDCENLCFGEGCKDRMIDIGTFNRLYSENKDIPSINIDQHYCEEHNSIINGECGHKITLGEAQRCYNHCFNCVSK